MFLFALLAPLSASERSYAADIKIGELSSFKLGTLIRDRQGRLRRCFNTIKAVEDPEDGFAVQPITICCPLGQLPLMNLDPRYQSCVATDRYSFRGTCTKEQFEKGACSICTVDKISFAIQCPPGSRVTCSRGLYDRQCVADGIQTGKTDNLPNLFEELPPEKPLSELEQLVMTTADDLLGFDSLSDQDLVEYYTSALQPGVKGRSRDGCMDELLKYFKPPFDALRPETAYLAATVAACCTTNAIDDARWRASVEAMCARVFPRKDDGTYPQKYYYCVTYGTASKEICNVDEDGYDRIPSALNKHKLRKPPIVIGG